MATQVDDDGAMCGQCLNLVRLTCPEPPLEAAAGHNVIDSWGSAFSTNP